MATVIAESGDESSADEPMYVHMYPNTASDDNECENAIGTRMENICDELMSFNSIDYYKIVVRYDHPGLDATSKSDFWNEFTSWYDSKNYDQETGAHLGVGGGFSGGRAHGSDGSDKTSFTRGKAAIVGLESSKEYFSNIAIQEVLHTFIRKDISGVEELIDDNDEHDLGHVYDNHSSSPMATGYEGTHSTHGTCDNAPGHWDLYKASLTNCAKDGVYHTAEIET